MRGNRRRPRFLIATAFCVWASIAAAGCDSPPLRTATTPSPRSSAHPSVTPRPLGRSPAAPSPTGSARREGRGETPVVVGEPVELETLRGRIVFDDFENVYTMNADGSGLRTVAGRAGAEFDGVWAPDGTRIAYRDSRRGINEDDEIFVVDADGSNPRNVTNHPGNDWGPDWSADGEWIVFNSDRDGPLRSWLVRPDGSDLTRIETDVWAEYPSIHPDGTRIAFAGPAAGDYDVYVADMGAHTRLTDAPGADGWPVWSPDGTLIAFSTERDDCARVPTGEDCWRTGEPGEHHDIWLMNADGSGQRRVTPEFGQFVAWSPDGQYLLVSGQTLYVVRADGTGRVEIRPDGLPYPAGGIPDWIGPGPSLRRGGEHGPPSIPDRLEALDAASGPAEHLRSLVPR